MVPIAADTAEDVLGPDGAPIRGSSGNGAAITRGGSAIVFGAEGVHTRDLHFTTRDATGWTAPLVLTADSGPRTRSSRTPSTMRRSSMAFACARPSVIATTTMISISSSGCCKRPVDEIEAAMARGDFYASTGALFDDLECADGALRVWSKDPSAKLECVAGRPGSMPGAVAHGGGRVCLPGEGEHAYVRAEITDAAGRRAWTQPCWR